MIVPILHLGFTLTISLITPYTLSCCFRHILLQPVRYPTLSLYMDRPKRKRASERIIGPIKRAFHRSVDDADPDTPSLDQNDLSIPTSAFSLQSTTSVTSSGAPNPYQSLVTVEKRSTTFDSGLSALIQIVSALKESSDAFPPLKATTGALLVVLDRISVRLCTPSIVCVYIFTIDAIRW